MQKPTGEFKVSSVSTQMIQLVFLTSLFKPQFLFKSGWIKA